MAERTPLERKLLTIVNCAQEALDLLSGNGDGNRNVTVRNPDDPMTEPQKKKIIHLVKTGNISDEYRKQLGDQLRGGLKKGEASDIISELMGKPNEKPAAEGAPDPDGIPF